MSGYGFLSRKIRRQKWKGVELWKGLKMPRKDLLRFPENQTYPVASIESLSDGSGLWLRVGFSVRFLSWPEAVHLFGWLDELIAEHGQHGKPRRPGSPNKR